MKIEKGKIYRREKERERERERKEVCSHSRECVYFTFVCGVGGGGWATNCMPSHVLLVRPTNSTRTFGSQVAPPLYSSSTSSSSSAYASSLSTPAPRSAGAPQPTVPSQLAHAILFVVAHFPTLPLLSIIIAPPRPASVRRGAGA